MDLNYRYYKRWSEEDANFYREAADPVAVTYQGEYYLFSSKTLDLNYQLYKTSVQIISLNKGIPYYFRIGSFNRNGYTKNSMFKSIAAL